MSSNVNLIGSETIETQSKIDEILSKISNNLPNDKARGVFNRITSSPLFWATLQTSTLAVVAKVLVGAAISGYVCIPVIGFGLLGLGCYIYIRRKELRYEVSLLYTVALNKLTRNHSWWNEICDHLVLGAIPLRDKGHLWSISREKRVSAVLTLLEKFENHKPGLFTTPVQPSDWKAAKVEHLQILAKDYNPVKMHHIVKGVQFIHEHIEKKETVYVHCKAGRGRSATVVVCYLLKHKQLNNVSEAIDFVKKRRPEISLNSKQRASIDGFFAAHCQKGV